MFYEQAIPRQGTRTDRNITGGLARSRAQHAGVNISRYGSPYLAE